VPLIVVRHPVLSDEDRAAFDRLLEATPDGAVVDYRLQQPKWWFLHHQIERGFLVHGSNEAAISEFRTRANLDAHQQPIEAVFASDDAIWPLYFAVVNRPFAQSYINWCEHVGETSRSKVMDHQEVLQLHLTDTSGDGSPFLARNARVARRGPDATNWGSAPVRSRCKTSVSADAFAWSSSRTAAKAAASVAKSPIMLPVSRCQMV